MLLNKTELYTINYREGFKKGTCYYRSEKREAIAIYEPIRTVFRTQLKGGGIMSQDERLLSAVEDLVGELDFDVAFELLGMPADLQEKELANIFSEGK